MTGGIEARSPRSEHHPNRELEDAICFQLQEEAGGRLPGLLARVMPNHRLWIAKGGLRGARLLEVLLNVAVDGNLYAECGFSTLVVEGEVGRWDDENPWATHWDSTCFVWPLGDPRVFERLWAYIELAASEWLA